MICRNCKSSKISTALDLGYQPPSNAYKTREDQYRYEVTYPLRLNVCKHCWLVQVADFTEASELFNAEYAYFSSTSKTWLAHAKKYCDNIIDRLGLNSSSFVLEIASNDGYLLKNFMEAGIPCLGIEPTRSTANASKKLGIKTLEEFFDVELAQSISASKGNCDLILGNNVYAHVPDINGFTRGIALLLKPEGVVTLEFPHLLHLVQKIQFDTIYHEHYSYLSLNVVKEIFEAHGLRVFDCETLSTHGGSLRVFGCKINASHEVSPVVEKILEQESAANLKSFSTYQQLAANSIKIKNETLSFLLQQKKLGKRVVAYGAAAKGNTFINFAGIKSDLVEYVCDAAASKQGKFLPGSNIPIYNPSRLNGDDVDIVWILPWNIKEEVIDQLSALRQKGAKFFTSIPKLIIQE